MKKRHILAAAILAASAAVTPAHAEFTVGGVNGWEFSTDGFLNVFAVYQTTEKRPADGLIGGNLQDPDADAGQSQQQFRIRTGLLPVGIGLNVKAPTINGIESKVRLGIYPQIQNNGGSRTDISPNIDFREINITAKGAFGEVLVGRAINLYQAKNILTDMTLFGAGVVGPVNSGPTMGHIGYGYLYPNFGAQLRYTTPEKNGVKLAVSVNDTNNIGAATIRNVPRLESEVSYSGTLKGATVQAWVSGLYQTAKFEEDTVRPGQHATSAGGAGGVQVGIGNTDMLVSGYGGKALGMLGIQGDEALDATGHERTNWGFLAQTTYKINPEWKVGVNYGRSHSVATAADSGNNIKSQEAAVGAVTYQVMKHIQVIGEYTWARDTWHNGLHQDSRMFALGTFFYW